MLLCFIVVLVRKSHLNLDLIYFRFLEIAELIGRQHDGIKRCREAEQSIKRILKWQIADKVGWHFPGTSNNAN